MNVRKKLEVFSKAALAEAEKKSSVMLQEMDDEYNISCERIRAEAASDANKRIESETRAAERQANKSIAEAKAEVRRKNADLCRALTDELFGEVLQMLQAYTKTEQYKKALLRDIASVLKKYGGGSTTLYLSPGDMETGAAFTEVKAVKDGGADMIGGFKALIDNRNVIADYSYSAMLANAKAEFAGFRVDYD